MVVDHVPAAPVSRRLAARQGEQCAGAEEHLQPILEQMHPQVVADQPRRHRVEHLAQREPAVGGDPHPFDLEVLHAALRQRLQGCAFGVDTRPVAGVVAPDQFGDQPAVGVQVIELTRAAQQQGLIEGALEVAVGTLDAAVLMGGAAVVAGRAHAVVLAQFLVALREIVAGGGVKVAERGRQAVGAVFLGRPSERPQRLLQAGTEGAEGLAPQHHGRVLEAGVGQPEVVQQVRQRRAGDDDSEVGGVGEVRQAQQSGRPGLREDHLLVGTVQGARCTRASGAPGVPACGARWAAGRDGGASVPPRWSPRAGPAPAAAGG